MKTINILALLFVTFGFHSPAIAPVTIEGCITDSFGEGLIYANVQIKGTEKGTSADLEGCFSIDVAELPVTLQISYTGFETKEVLVASSDEKLAIILEEGATMDEVVVTGLSRTRRTKRSESERSDVRLMRSEMAVATSSSAPPPPPPPPPPTVEEIARPHTSSDRSSAVTYEAEAKSIMPASSMAESDYVAGGGSDDVAYEDVAAGQLTAGEVNDFSKWEMWEDISQEDLARHRSTWQQYADHRYMLQLTNEDGKAVVNASVQLSDGQGNVLWKAKTDPSGKAELWAHFFQEVGTPANGLEISGTAKDATFKISDVKPFSKGINFHTLAVACTETAVIDLAFVVDATGSMQDEINYLQAELLDVVQRVQDSLPAANLQLGSVFYRDKGEEYLTRTHPLNNNPNTTIEFIKGQSADGGGDTPEAVEDALEDAIENMKWRSKATSRLLFLVLDAPPHDNEESVSRMQVLTTKAAAKGIQIIPVTCSGVDKSTEYLMRCLALATNGTYTFLTDHSGIGNPHIEPSTDAYDVEHLNDLMVRLIVQFSALNSCTENNVLAQQHNNTPFKNARSNTEAGWNAYPNPTNGPVTIEFPADADGTLFLTDANGKILQRLESIAAMPILDLAYYPAGNYWLIYHDAAGVVSQSQVILARS